MYALKLKKYQIFQTLLNSFNKEFENNELFRFYLGKKERNTEDKHRLTFPVSNLFMLSAESLRGLSPESCFSPYKLIKTLASVPAPLVLPV